MQLIIGQRPGLRCRMNVIVDDRPGAYRGHVCDAGAQPNETQQKKHEIAHG
jgi:hypothetical protein